MLQFYTELPTAKKFNTGCGFDLSGMGKRVFNNNMKIEKPYECSPWLHTDMGDKDVQWFSENNVANTLMLCTFSWPLCIHRPGKHSQYSDLLWAGRSKDRIPVGDVIFSTPIQASAGAHPASHTMDTGSFSGVKRPGRGNDHPPPIQLWV